MNITVFTIAYNGYAKFLPEWIENIKNQEVKPDRVVIILGANHGGNVEELKELLKWTSASVLERDGTNMGFLRNQAIKVIKSDWMLYFSADDILLPNAIKLIRQKSKAVGAVALNYIKREVDGTEEDMVSASFAKSDMKDWKTKFPIPGYIAVKRKHQGKVMYYDEIEIPNFPYLFKLAKNSVKVNNTKETCAIYARRKDSHGDISFRTQKFKKFTKIINDEVEKEVDVPPVVITIDSKDGVTGTTTIEYIDKNLGKVEKGSKIVYTKERYSKLKSLGFIK